MKTRPSFGLAGLGVYVAPVASYDPGRPATPGPRTSQTELFSPALSNRSKLPNVTDVTREVVPAAGRTVTLPNPPELPCCRPGRAEPAELPRPNIWTSPTVVAWPSTRNSPPPAVVNQR